MTGLCMAGFLALSACTGDSGVGAPEGAGPEETVAPRTLGLFLDDAAVPRNVRPKAKRARTARLNPEVVGVGPDWLDELETVELRLFEDVTLEVTRERVEVAPSGNLSWIGYTSDRAAQVILTGRGGQLVADVSGPQGTFSVKPAGDGLVVIQEGGSNFLPCAEAPVPPALPQELQAREDIQALTDEGLYIDVLQVYTADAASEYGATGTPAQIQQFMQSRCDADVAWLNQAYLNSGCNITMRNVGVESIDYTESDNPSWDLRRLSYVGENNPATVSAQFTDSLGDLWATGGPYLEAAHTARDAYGADLVMLRTGGYSSSGGQAWVTLAPNTAYNIYGFAVMGNPDDTAVTMAHEFGHNQGLGHDYATNDNKFAETPYAMGYRVEGQLATIMAYPSPLDFDLVVQYFSNPNIFVNAPGGGGQMRLSDISLPVGQRPDAHRRLNEMVDTISNFRTHVQAYSPAAPSLLTATSSTASTVSLQWVDNTVGEDRFQLQRRKAGETTWTTVAVAPNQTSSTLTGLEEFTQYFFRIRTKVGSEASPFSNTVGRRTLPNAPTGLALTVVNDAQIRLDWTDASAAETTVVAARKVGAGSFVNQPALGANTITFTDSGLPASTVVSYKLRNLAGTVPSAFTETLWIKTAPAIPTNLNATRTGATSIQVTWTDASSDEGSFQLQRKVGAGAFAIYRNLGAGVTSFNDTGLTTGTLYTYRLRSRRGSAFSRFSNQDSATP